MEFQYNPFSIIYEGSVLSVSIPNNIMDRTVIIEGDVISRFESIFMTR